MYAAQRPHKQNKGHSGGKKGVVSPSSLTAASRKPTSWSMMIQLPRKRREKLAKNCKSESAKSDPEDVGNTYGIYHLKIGEAKHDSDDSKLLLAQRTIGHKANKINNDKVLHMNETFYLVF